MDNISSFRIKYTKFKENISIFVFGLCFIFLPVIINIIVSINTKDTNLVAGAQFLIMGVYTAGCCYFFMRFSERPIGYGSLFIWLMWFVLLMNIFLPLALAVLQLITRISTTSGIFLTLSIIVQVIGQIILIVLLAVKAFPKLFSFLWTSLKREFKKIIMITIIGLALMYAANYLGAWLQTVIGISNSSDNQNQINSIWNSSIIAQIFIIVGTCIVSPIIEEFSTRLGMTGVLKNKALIVICSTIFFANMHVYGDFKHIIPYFLMGLVLGGIFVYTNNITYTIIIHAGWNIFTTIMIFSS